ncbi:hypothetical protein S7711_10336 [Stachybotrys chartarum IBT 7711]|uniref:Secreted LysM effector LysM C-terminal domain-containing protein n=1 Tax=Stachybotrys chartarum (strain CBS 109288 / IBT 7711) TaxID=1280523 RepID=A0A084B3H5_STACB|nr:hypothetical protein S7711_10336 [Stachybotrys chartarum IBT 7711]KFA52353.1 hypothetical protein S40293_10397 [Stachybotrys chartarum IBT 40293]KFA77330.1 hypothetical protein S40288_10582 [Stachybotrys chartarum IBT 40288]
MKLLQFTPLILALAASVLSWRVTIYDDEDCTDTSSRYIVEGYSEDKWYKFIPWDGIDDNDKTIQICQYFDPGRGSASGPKSCETVRPDFYPRKVDVESGLCFAISGDPDRRGRLFQDRGVCTTRDEWRSDWHAFQCKERVEPDPPTRGRPAMGEDGPHPIESP